MNRYTIDIAGSQFGYTVRVLDGEGDVIGAVIGPDRQQLMIEAGEVLADQFDEDDE